MSLSDRANKYLEKANEERFKKIFNLFGHAYYQGESLHRGLCLLLAFYSFEKKEINNYLKKFVKSCFKYSAIFSRYETLGSRLPER